MQWMKSTLILLWLLCVFCITFSGCITSNGVTDTETVTAGEIVDVNPIKQPVKELPKVVSGSVVMPERYDHYEFIRFQEDENVYSDITYVGNDVYTVSITPLKTLPIEYAWDYVLCGEINEVLVKEERVNYEFENPRVRTTAATLVKGDTVRDPIRVVNKSKSVVDKTVQKRVLPERISSRGYCAQGIILGNNRTWFNETIQYNITIPYVEGRNITLWLGNGTEGTVGTSEVGARAVSSSFTKRVWYSELTNRWYAVGIDANSDVFISSTGDGENYTLGGVIAAGTYDYKDVSCAIDEDGVSWLHCGHAQSGDNTIEYTGIRLTSTSPYVDIGTEYTVASDGSPTDDLSFPRVNIGSDRCVAILYQNEVSGIVLYVTKEAHPCGDGTWSTNSSYPVSVETGLTDDDGPIGFIQSRAGADSWFTWVDAVSGDFDFKAKAFNIANGSQGSEVLLEGDLEGGTYRKVDATAYNDSSGEHFVGWGAVDGDSTNVYSFVLDGFSDTSETTYSTSVLDPELAITSSFYDDMTIVADTFYGNLYGFVHNDTDGNGLSFANSTNGGSSYTYMGDFTAAGVSTVDQFTSGYSIERCEVMVAYHTSFQSYEMRTNIVSTNSPCKQENIWWDTDYNSRINLTFDTSSTTEALVNYPLLVRLNSSLIDYSSTQDSGQDIRFVDMDKSTALDYEIETWNETGESIVWVRVHQLNPKSNHTIYLYYNNTGASDGQNAAGVWDSDFVGVFHLDESSSGTGNAGAHEDSTGTIDADDEISATGKEGIAGLGQEFDGSDDWLNVNDVFSSYPQAGNGNFTVEAWFYHDTYAIDGNSYFLFGDDGFTRGVYGHGGFQNQIRITNLGSGTGAFSSNNVFSTGAWQYAVWTEDSDSTPQQVVYVDKVSEIDSNSDPGTDIVSGDNFSIAGPPRGSFGHAYFDGDIDEVRVSRGVRSQSYINMTYEMIYTGVTSYGAQENNGGGGGGGDTCSCPSPAANWEIDLADNCVLSSTCNLAGFDVTFIGSGTFTCNASFTADTIEVDANLGGIIGSACSVVYG